MEIKIISFNIWDLPLWFVRDRAKRLALIIDYIKSNQADIICLQEAFDPKHRQELELALKDYNYAANGSAEQRKILYLKRFDNSGGLAIFSKFPILESHFIPHNRLASATIGEVFGRKGVFTAIIETPLGKIKIINVHLHEESVWLVDKLIRQYQLNKIVNRLNGQDMTTVLCGDFNEHNFIKRPLFKDIEAKGFLNPTDDPLEPTYRVDNKYFNGLFNRRAGSKRFDYIFVRHLEILNLQVKSYARELLDPPLSDHDPISLILSSK